MSASSPAPAVAPAPALSLVPAPRRGRPPLLKTCNCPIARHDHGSRQMYARHKCRCSPCRKATSDYMSANSRHRPRVPMVDAALLTARIRVLHAAGLTQAAIAELSGIPVNTIHKLANSGPGFGMQRSMARNLDALNRISYRDVMLRPVSLGTMVDGPQVRRKIQELHARGWCPEYLAAAAGIDKAIPYRILRGYTTTEAMRVRLEAGYLALRDIYPPVDTPLNIRRRARALAKAAANGWTVDMADDEFSARAA